MSQQTNDVQQFDIREYAIGSASSRHQFHPSSFSATLIGQEQVFQSVFVHSAKIKQYYDLNHSLSGYREAVAADALFIDIDSKPDLAAGLTATTQIMYRLREEYQVAPQYISVCFSGNKGFHIEIPATLFGGFAPSPELPILVKSIVEQLVGEAFGHVLDLSIYKHTSLIRICNTKHGASGLYAVPLSLEELESKTVEEIRLMATSVRADLIVPGEPSGITASQKLVTLKYEAISRLASGASNAQDLNTEASYSSLDIANWDKITRHCKALQQTTSKSAKKDAIGHDERVALGCIATAFGEAGKKKVHEILKGQANYDRARTEDYLDSMADSLYKPQLCNTICGPENHCDAIKAINRKSPIAFAYTYDKTAEDKKRYVESYAVEKIVAHFSNLIYVANEKLFYEYNHGVYLKVDLERLKARICEFLPYYFPLQDITNSRLNSLVERVKVERAVRYDGALNTNTQLVNVQNGMFDLATGKLLAHDMKYRSTVQLPLRYNPHAACPRFDAFMNQTFGNDQDVIDYVLKLWCYLLLPTYSFQKVWVWIGDGRNGKGVLTRLISLMLGSDNVSYEDIHQLAHERFSSINLKDKLVNISSELRADELDMTQLKKLSGEDFISAEYKGKDKIFFKSFARLLIAGNSVPRFTEAGPAITERFEFIRFNNIVTTPDTTLEPALAAELPGIFNRVIGQYKNIATANGGIYFDAPKVVQDAKTDILRDISSVVEFIDTACERQAGNSTSLQHLYKIYQLWCKDCGYKPLGRNRYAETLRKTCDLKVVAGTGNTRVVQDISTSMMIDQNGRLVEC